MMPMFHDSEDVYRHLAGLFDYVVAGETLAAAAAVTGLVARLRLSEPDSVIVVDFPARKVYVGEAATDVRAAVELAITADVAHAMWLGRVQPAALLATRKVKIRGSARKLLKMQGLGEQLIPVSEKMLRDANRADLLAA